MGGAARSSLLPISSAHPIGLAPGSSHRRGGGFFSFFARPPPACSSLLACRGLFPRPRPGDVLAAVWLAAAGGRACSPACYRVRAALSLRSFARCYMPRVACVVVPTLGVVGHFTEYSDRLPVGVGVFKYMPLNRILWLLMGIFGDGVRRPFSALPAASLSPLCPAFRPFPVAVSWRWRGRFPAVSLVKRRVCVLSCSRPFSASRVMGWMASGPVFRAGLMASAGRRAYLYRFARPLPLGAGEYMRSAGIVSVCGEGVGGIVEVLPISWPVVVSSRRLRHPLPSACLLRCSLCRPRPPPPPLLRPFLPSAHAFSCGFLSLFSPFLRRAGRGVSCLLVSFVAALFLSSRFPHSLRSSPCLLALRGIALFSSFSFPSSSSPSPCSCLIVALISLVSPRSSTSVGWACGGSFFACLPSFSVAVSHVVRAACVVLAGIAICVGIVDCSIYIYNLSVVCYSIGIERKQTERTYDEEAEQGD